MQALGSTNCTELAAQAQAWNDTCARLRSSLANEEHAVSMSRLQGATETEELRLSIANQSDILLMRQQMVIYQQGVDTFTIVANQA